MPSRPCRGMGLSSSPNDPTAPGHSPSARLHKPRVAGPWLAFGRFTLWRAKEVSPLGRGVPLCFSCQELRGADAFEPPRIALVLSDLRVPVFEQGVVGLVHEHGVGLCGID